MKRTCLLASDGKIQSSNFGLVIPENTPIAVKCNSEPNKDELIGALENNKHNISQTAKQLGMSRQSLYRRMDKFDIPRTY